MGDEYSSGTPSGVEHQTAIGPGQMPAALLPLSNRYRVERVLGEGAFGRVYLAFDTVLGSDVAIKELLAARSGTEPERYAEYAERFRREARAARISQHPNIVTIYDLIEEGTGSLYLVMEYVDGINLRDLLTRDGALSAARALAITLDVARALDAIHVHGIVHRDLKPANIMITRIGTAKVTDFGVALLASEMTAPQTDGSHPGTPMYMSPEQAATHGAIDGRSDLYSLGLVLYEMLSGESYARRRLPLPSIQANVPPHVAVIVERLLQPDAALRYASAAEVIEAVEAVHDASELSDHASGPVAYPAMAVAASTASRTGQRKYLRCIQLDLGLLVLGGAFALIASVNSDIAQILGATVAALLLIGSIAAKATNRINRYDRAWFDGRAVAETVKKMAWQYMMRVTPYDTSNEAADILLLAQLQQIIKERGIFHVSVANLEAGTVQITAPMRVAREAEFAHRKAFYAAQRIEDQITWYTRKTRENAGAATFWFWSTLLIQCGAVAMALFRIVLGGPNVVAVLVTIAAAGTAWSQVGRFDELSKTYALTATNLTFARTKLEAVKDDGGFGEVVSETEDYISREHQTWLAKHG